MNETPRLDPARGAAIRSMLTETVRLTPRRRVRPGVVVFASLATAAVVIAVGVGYAATGMRHQPGIAGGPHVGTSTAPTTRPTPGPTPTDEPGNLSQAGSPSPTPIPDPVDPADPSTWRITFGGIGPLTIGGAQKEQGEQLVGFAEAGDVLPGCPARFYEPTSGSTTRALRVATSSDNVADVTSLIIISATGLSGEGSSAFASESPKTAAGIGLGASLDEVKAAYPDVALTGGDSQVETYYGIKDASGRWLVFTIDPASGLVSSITLSSASTPPPELCG